MFNKNVQTRKIHGLIITSLPISFVGTTAGHHAFSTRKSIIGPGADPEAGGQSGHGSHPVLPWTLAPLQRREKIFNLNFLNFCDYFVKKVGLVSEIRKCHHFQGDLSL